MIGTRPQIGRYPDSCNDALIKKKGLLGEGPSDIVILGGGISGLSAAHGLNDGHRRIAIIEKEGRVGGMLRTMQFDSYRFDLGPHRLYFSNRHLHDEVEKLLHPNVVTNMRKSAILLDGVRYNYPLLFFDILGKISYRQAVMTVCSCALAMMQRIFVRNERALSDWITHRFGFYLYHVFFRGYTQKVIGQNPKQISSYWGCRRIERQRLLDLIRCVFVPQSQRFIYPTIGIGALCDRLAEEITASGRNQIITGATVSRVEVHQGKIESVTYQINGKTTREPVSFCLSTIPVTKLVSKIYPAPPDAVLKAASRLRHRNIIFLFLFIQRENITENQWIYTPDENLRFFRITEYKNFSSVMAPVGNTVLSLEFAVDEEEPLWHGGDEEIYLAGVNGLKRLGLCDGDEVRHHLVFRLPDAYPVYPLDFPVSLGTVFDYIDSIDNLACFGRQGAFDYLSVGECMEMGFKVARLLGASQSL